ncbi:MAG: tetratricopeptide repeat protein [Chloroflexi bacterium]|nr:MAG: tetratricopeptide repeat protein [Chloroflexota bacterium]
MRDPHQRRWTPDRSEAHWHGGSWSGPEPDSSPDGDGDGWYRQGVALLRQGRPFEAVELLERALRLAPDDRDLLAHLAAARRAIGDVAGAAAIRRALLAWPPEQDVAS